MIEILQPEINVIPGDTPRTPGDRGWVGQGRTVITVTNETNRNNSYRIHLECPNPRWKEYWYGFVALPPDNPQAILQNMEDVYGPNNSWVQIYVPQKQTRRIILDVKADRLAEARAGAYPLTVVARVSIASDRGGNWVEDAIHRLDAVALMRPYYQWNFRIEPETARVGLFRKSRPYEVVIENHGNDWLYCELEPPRLQNVMIEQPPTARIAVPPPEDNRLPSVRSVPFKASTKHRQIRGSIQDMPIPMVVRRVDAPTIPPLPPAALQGPASAQYRNAVTYKDPDQKDAQKPPTDAVLSYHPPIPVTVEGCGKALVQNIKGIVLMAIGLIVLWHLLDFMGARLIDEAQIRGVELHAQNNQKKYEVEGKYLYKAKIVIVDADTGKDIKEEEILPGFDREQTRGRYYISLEGVANRRIRLESQRKVMISYLAALIPRTGDKTQTIVVGAPVRTDYSLTVDPELQIGKEFTLLTPGYAGDIKTIRLGTTDLKPTRTQGTDRVVGMVPADYPVTAGAPVAVDVSVFGDSTEKPLATAHTMISHEPPPTPAATAAADAGADGGSSGGATGGASTSGGSTGNSGTPPSPPPATPGASGATSALLSHNPAAAKQAAAQSPNDPIAMALAAIACYQSGDSATGDSMLSKAEAATQDSSASPRARILVQTAKAVQAEKTGNPDADFLQAIESVKSADPTNGIPLLLAIDYYKGKGDKTMAKSVYSDATMLPLPADQMKAIQTAGAGL